MQGGSNFVRENDSVGSALKSYECHSQGMISVQAFGTVVICMAKKNAQEYHNLVQFKK